MAEETHALGQRDAIDPVLHVRVLVPDMDTTLPRGVERHARRFQQHLGQGLVVAARLLLDILLGELVRRGPDPRLDLDPRFFQPLGRHRQVQRLLRGQREVGARGSCFGNRHDGGGGFESFLFTGDDVGAGGDVGKAEIPLVVGGRPTGDLAVTRLEPDLRTAQWPPERVLDGPRNVAPLCHGG